jgi:hypothetical protein
MPFDDPACFRLDRIPVRPIHWLGRPYLACGKLALQVGIADGAKLSLRPDAGAGQAARRRGRPARAEGRPGVLVVVRSVLAARRRMTSMRVRPTDPCRAPCRPYGLGRRRRLPQSKATPQGSRLRFDSCTCLARPQQYGTRDEAVAEGA